jgi:formylglycine-generating enzyme required for sulfatase activity
MIKKLLFIFCIFFILCAFVSVKKKEFIPPGTVKINDTLYADETEISNASWNEYEVWMKNKYGHNSSEHLSALRDTSVWHENHTYNDPYVHYYHTHQAYAQYPVVGINYEQALAFCKWRTERIKEFMCISKKYSIIDFEYRLPSKEEWEFLSNNGTNVFSNNGLNSKGLFKTNTIQSLDSCHIISENAINVTAPVYSYKENRFGIYNMIGNVSEMVKEKGISKGGSWRHRLESCRPGKDILYSKPTAWLGFRCVCVVKKSKAS